MKNKKNKKDYYLKLDIKRNFSISLFVIFLGIIFVFFSERIIQDKKEFLKDGIKTQAVIVDIEYKFISDTKEIEKVYVKYNVNNKIYTGKLKEISSNMYVGKNIDIYYNPNNPQDFIQNDVFSNNLFKYAGYLILALGCYTFLKAINELILYISTLNARVVEAKIETVIEKGHIFYELANKGVVFLDKYNLNKHDVKTVNYKTYIIKCVWEDEIGNNYVFYSKKYDEPYFKTEFEKLNLETLKVRFKSAKKYIVLTEKIDRKLMA